MHEYVLSALIFGFTAGFKPGPLGLVVIQQTLEHGLKHGLKACLAPILTDGPIIVIALVLLAQFSDKAVFIGFLSAVGGLYLLWIAIKIFRVKEIKTLNAVSSPRSLETAIKINLLSPNPYIFWFTVGGPYLALGTKAEAAAFIIVSIGTLVVSKMITAWIAAHFRKWLDSKAYLWVMRFLGLLVAGFGVLFLVRSYHLLTGE